MPTKSHLTRGAVLALLCLVAPAFHSHATADPLSITNRSSGELLTLKTVVARALQTHPELSVYTEESHARAEEVTQAARLANPELTLEIANMTGSGSYQGFDAAETTVELSQKIELGGKRRLRRSAAEMEHERSLRELEMARIDLQTRITRHFLTLLQAQERTKLSAAEIALTAQTLSVIEEKIAAGKAPAVEKYRFQSAMAEAQLKQEQALIALVTVRQTLADDLGLQEASLGEGIGDLAALPSLPTPTDIDEKLARNPEILRSQLESEARRRTLEMTRADRIIDPVVGLGLRNFNATDDHALTLSLSLPLPLFDRNQGHIQAASHRLTAAQAHEESRRRQSRAEAAASRQVLAANLAEAQVLREQILPAAQQTFDAVSYGYQAGKFGVLEVQEAQHKLIDGKTRYLDVLLTAQLAAVELDRLLGYPPLSIVVQVEKE